MKDFNKSEIHNLKLANHEFLSRRIKRLRENTAARSVLFDLGIKEETIKEYFLGMSERYKDAKSVIRENALIAPVINKEGKPSSRSIYINIPGITINPISPASWAKGNAYTYYSAALGEQESIFVCPNVIDLWLIWQLVCKTALESKILFVSSSQPNKIPKDWYQREFWEQFGNIYVAGSRDHNNDKIILNLNQILRQQIRKIALQSNIESWQEFCRLNELNSEVVQKLLDKAVPVGSKYNSGLNEVSLGRFGFQPVDIAGAFHNGFLYYPVKTIENIEENFRDESGKHVSQIVTKIEIVLIRSDRTVQTASQVPAPRGTPLERRVLRLSDGTLIESPPKSSVYSTWSWDSVQKFCAGKTKTRSLGEILKDVKDFLKESAWLPFRHDYDLLTLLVPVTFAQAIFQSVPLVLVTGPPGSGKTVLGRAMVKICANAVTIGQTSAAAIARLIDETKGFVVFDDLEAIGKRKGREATHFTELVQSLKLSYNKQTSWKLWTDVSRGMSVKRLNFYGVKMINNTTGADHILGSRLLKIYTQKIPKSLQLDFNKSEEWNPVVLENLRDELHTWVFENVGLIDETYRRRFLNVADRDSEITAPLYVFAEIAEFPALREGLEKALKFQTSVPSDSTGPIDLMKEAVKRLVLSGFVSLSPTHISLEMKRLSSDNSRSSYFNENLKSESVIWIGRQLREQGLVDVNAEFSREFLFGKYLRIYPLDSEFVAKTLNHGSLTENVLRSALDFCSFCNECRYSNIDCSIRDSRLKSKKRK